MIEFKNIKYSKPRDLFLLLSTTLVLLFFLIKYLILLLDNKILVIVFSFTLSAYYFFYLKKKIIKESVFKLFADRFEYENKKVYFNSIKEYKIHWVKGAGLKINLKNDTTIRISANKNFYNTDNFVSFCEKLDTYLSNHYNGIIIRKKSFLETKFGLYFTLLLGMYLIIIAIYELFK